MPRRTGTAAGVPFLPVGAAPIQHVENDHVPGIVPEPLHRKLALSDNDCVISHGRIVPFAKKER